MALFGHSGFGEVPSEALLSLFRDDKITKTNMQREIKFRIWNKEKSRFEPKGYSNECFISSEGMEIKRVQDHDSWDKPNVISYNDKNNYIIQQYTGLKDKNGVEIFEGDIVCVFLKTDGGLIYRKETVEIKWDEENCGFGIKQSNNHDYLVVGNIHKNPELLN